MARPVVAIVGRPNVGKSTVFNRIIGERMAIVEDIPGITRDRIFGSAEWNGRPFHIIDTGGIEISNDELLLSVRVQAELAIAEADVIVFMVDATAGVTPADEQVAEMLYRANKPVVVAANKVDNQNRQDWIYDFYTLGFGEPVAISGAHGLGIGDLLDRVAEHFPHDALDEEYDEDVIRVSLIGRPNVGKSSLVNAILGEERVIVSDQAGTTRDAIDTPFEMDGQRYVLIDTAGMRKRGKIYESTEKYSVMRALKAIDRSDVALIVLDGSSGVVEQDKHIAGYAHEAGKAAIFVVNKWDIVEKDDKTMQRFEEQVRDKFQFMPYAPVLFVSALTKRRLNRLLPLVNEVAESHAQRVPTHLVNEVLLDAVTVNPPPARKGKKAKINYATQVSVKPPTIIVFVNDPELVHFSYIRYLENKLREAFGFYGTPIRLFLRKKSER